MQDNTTTRPIPVRILLLDHHKLTRQGLRQILECGSKSLQDQLDRNPEQRFLERAGSFMILGETGQRAQALELAGKFNPNIILLELNLDGEKDPAIIGELLQAAPGSKIILVTAITDATLHKQAIQAGVMGIISKQDDQMDLIKAVQKVNAGEVWINRSLMADVLHSVRRSNDPDAATKQRSKLEQLSQREHDIIQLLGEGLKNKEIAERLSISEYTVRHNLTDIYNKLEVGDRLQLLIYAYQNNLVDLKR